MADCQVRAFPRSSPSLLAVLLTAAVGASFWSAWRSVRRSAAPALSLIILTVGASIAIRGVAGFVWGRDPVVLPAFSGEKPIALLGAAVHPQSLWVIGVTLGAMALLELALSHTMLGRAIKACSINRTYAGLVGIDPERMTMLSFGLSAALGALGGIVVAPMTMASYDSGVMLGLKGFTAAAVGGLGSQLGAVIGGLALGVLESFGAAVRSEFKDAIALVALFVVLFLRRGRMSAGARR